MATPTSKIQTRATRTASKPAGVAVPHLLVAERIARGKAARAEVPRSRVGTGHRARTWNYPLNSSSSISNPVVPSIRATSRRTSPKQSRLAWRG
jgi:hypothetical protein